MADSIAKAPVDFSAALKKAQEIAQKLGRSGPSEPGVPSSSWSSQEPSRQEDEDRFRREPREPRDRPDDYHRERDRRRSRSRSRSPGRRYDDSRDRDRDRYRGRDEDRSRSRYGLGSDEQKTRDQNRPGYGLSAAGAKQEEMTVPSSVVGLIIGKGGTNLKEIESDTKAKVQFKGEQTDPERHVTITGTAEAVDAARKRIQGVIADHNDRQATRFLQNTTSPVQSMPPIHYGGGGDRGGQGPPSRGPPMGMGDTSTTVAIPKSTVGLVIGRSGETVQRLSRESGTRINVTPDSQSDPNSNDRIVTIVGPPQAVEEAKRLIDEIVSTARENQGMRPNASMGMGMGVTGPGMLSDVMQVPSEYVGTIIGKQGSEIRNLESLTGCRINVQQAANGLVTRDISLRGTPEAIAYAKQLIEEKIEQAANRGGGGGGGGGGRRYQDNQNDYGQYQQQGQQASADPYAAWYQQQGAGQAQAQATATGPTPGGQPDANTDPAAYAAWWQQVMSDPNYAAYYAAYYQQYQGGAPDASGAEKPPGA